MDQRRIYIGTSGWTYNDWAGTFYPKGLKTAERLSCYISQFNALEINATFYRLPSQVMIDAWNRQFPEDFHLVVKGSRLVTHLKKLNDCGEALETFWGRASQLRTLRVILWQLPPTLPKDLVRLERFLSDLPGDVRHAVEFRHASWWDEEVAAVLRRRRAAFVAVSHPHLPAEFYPTADFLYLRFHGLGEELYRYDYSSEELTRWAHRLAPYLTSHAIFAFFNNTYHGVGPRNARVFAKLLANRRAD
jgi:uncharacterized protein YecE (DUF72 family)